MHNSALTKRALALLLSIVMIIGLLPTFISADDPAQLDWKQIFVFGQKNDDMPNPGVGNYMLVANNNNNLAAYMQDGTAAGANAVGSASFTLSNGQFTTMDRNYVWEISNIETSNGTGHYVKNIGQGLYLRPSSWEPFLTLDNGTTENGIPVVDIGGPSSSRFYIRAQVGNGNRYGYVAYSNNTFTGVRNNSVQYIRLFKQTNAGTDYYALDGQTSYSYNQQTKTREEIENEIKQNIIVWNNSSASEVGAQLVSDGDYTLTSADPVDPDMAGTYTYEVVYQGITLGTVSVEILERSITGISVNATSGWVREGAAMDTAVQNNVQITVSYDKGPSEMVSLTVANLTGDNFTTAVAGIYKNLSISYQGFQYATPFMLDVRLGETADYPDYPNEGSVKITKTANTRDNDYQSTGVARIDLTAVGVPKQKPLDVVVVIDTSSSMDRYAYREKNPKSNTALNNDNSSGSPVTIYPRNTAQNNLRFIDVLAYEVEDMLYRLAMPYEDGSPADVDLAMVQFNASQTSQSGLNFHPMIDYDNDRIKGASSVYTKTNHNGVVLGDVRVVNDDASSHVRANDFLDINDIVNPNKVFANGENAIQQLYRLAPYGGTNYDTALEMAYELISKKKVWNEQNNQEREAVVFFITDGVPYQYNFFTSRDGFEDWKKWLMGTYDAPILPVADAHNSSTHRYFYNGPGNPHRVAQAIKGDPNQLYTVVSHDQSDYIEGPDNTHYNYMKQVPGLGATIYSIAFAMAYFNELEGNNTEPAATEDCIAHILGNIASGTTAEEKSEYVKYAQTGTELGEALDTIRRTIYESATETVFTDVISDQFELQCANTLTRASDGHVFNLRTDDENDAGMTIKVGYYDCYLRGEVGTVVNGVTVTEDMVGQRKTNTPTNLETITFSPDGTAATSSLRPEVANIIDNETNKLVGEYVTYDFTEKKFTWNIGTLNEREVVLSFYEYLIGAMDGEAPAGSSDTNKGDATLSYINYLGHEAQKKVPTPRLPWGKGVVNYGFYLVDENGTPIVNTATGMTGSYANKVPVVNKTLFKTLGLNGEDSTVSVSALDTVPEGYEIYDPEATFAIYANSDGTGRWQITKKDGLATTTYVEDFGGTTAYTNVQDSDNLSGREDYTATTVWFAIKLAVSAVPDVVVIDYGIPVVADLLANDLVLNTEGVLNGISADWEGLNPFSKQPQGSFSEQVIMDNGTFSIVNDQGRNRVQYTPSTMEMQQENKIAYQVYYRGKPNTTGNYYSTFTVIPAAIIYYEDDFVTFINDDAAPSSLAAYDPESHGVWGTAGARVNATQAEDRPGLPFTGEHDANNAYGFDQAYANCTTYSLGSAATVQVQAGASSWPQATFDFAGTGFDIISTTDNTAGAIVVTVSDAAGAVEKRIAVNNYYSDPAGLYQIPVLKIADLPYGVHHVVIEPTYSAAFNFTTEDKVENDEDSKDNDYTFTLDAIRIYDPAGVNNTSVSGENVVLKAYQADGEAWPVYRNFRELLNEAGEMVGENNKNSVVFLDTLLEDLNAEEKEYLMPDGKVEKLEGGYMSSMSIGTYLKIGPNKEVYLPRDVAISLTLLLPPDVSRVELAAKSIIANQNAKLQFKVENNRRPVEHSIATATDRYYDLTDAFDMDAIRADTDSENIPVNILIANTGDTDSILSLTNLKVTRTSAHDAAEDKDVKFIDQPTLENQNFAIQMLKALFLPLVDNETIVDVEPEIEEPVLFTPEQLDIQWETKGKGKGKGEKNTILITASADVEAISVSGKLFTDYKKKNTKVGKGKNSYKVETREWKISVTGNSYEVVALNADSIASAPTTVSKNK